MNQSSITPMYGSRILCLAKIPIFSFAVVSFVIILFASSSMICNLSLHSIVLDTNTTPHRLHVTFVRPPNFRKIPTHHEVLLSVEKEANISAHEVLLPMKKVVEISKINDLDHSHDRQRIDCSKRKQTHFDMFKSTRLSGTQFDGRIRDFFGNDRCQIQFFMTWISPVRAFSEREFLALESLFKSNPKGCLVILSRTMDSALGCETLKPLLELGFSVISVTPDLSFLFKGTPAESWFNDIKRGKMDPGHIPLGQNLSNLIRLAVLYKYGGVYLDTDLIVLKDFSGLRNSIGVQSVDAFGNWTMLNNAVLVFNKSHLLLHKFMEEFALTFNGNKWGHNGPYLVSRVVKRMLKGQDCNFTVLSPMAFYPVDWTRISRLFANPVKGVHSKWVEAKLVQLREESYAVHLWNRKSSKLKIEEGSIIGRLISSNCIVCKNIYSS